MLTPVPDSTDIHRIVRQAVDDVAVCDIHTHLFDPAMGKLLLSGIDEILTYHYHVAELFRVQPDLDYDAFWNMRKGDQADLVWRELFVERAPVSEVGKDSHSPPTERNMLIRSAATVRLASQSVATSKSTNTLWTSDSDTSARDIETYEYTRSGSAMGAPNLFVTSDPVPPTSRFVPCVIVVAAVI